MRTRTGIRRTVATAAISLGVILFGTSVAGAHIGIDPESAPRGAEVTTLQFSVPNESDTVPTVKLELVMPTKPKLTFFRAQPIPGWTMTVQKAADGTVTGVTWEGGQIGPGEFEEFGIRVGPMPKKGKQVYFNAVQTYADGEVSRWIQKPAPGAADPEYPAPVLELTAATEGSH